MKHCLIICFLLQLCCCKASTVVSRSDTTCTHTNSQCCTCISLSICWQAKGSTEKPWISKDRIFLSKDPTKRPIKQFSSRVGSDSVLWYENMNICMCFFRAWFWFAKAKWHKDDTFKERHHTTAAADTKLTGRLKVTRLQVWCRVEDTGQQTQRATGSPSISGGWDEQPAPRTELCWWRYRHLKWSEPPPPNNLQFFRFVMWSCVSRTAQVGTSPRASVLTFSTRMYQNRVPLQTTSKGARTTLPSTKPFTPHWKTQRCSGFPPLWGGSGVIWRNNGDQVSRHATRPIIRFLLPTAPPPRKTPPGKGAARFSIARNAASLCRGSGLFPTRGTRIRNYRTEERRPNLCWPHGHESMFQPELLTRGAEICQTLAFFSHQISQSRTADLLQNATC